MKSRDTQLIISATKAGGKIVKKYFGQSLDIEQKSRASDVRTCADLESEQEIIKELDRHFPTYNIYSEECGFLDRKSEYTFYIDPLDGTNNFVLGIPNFSVIVALVRGREVIFGAVHLPMLDITYHAEKGGGAFCDGKKMSTSSEISLERSTTAFLCNYSTDKEYVGELLSKLSLGTKRVLCNWSVGTDLCLVASGKTENVVNVKTEPWDFLAAKFIVKEAGGIVTDLVGQSETDDFNSSFVASGNIQIHKQIIALL